MKKYLIGLYEKAMPGNLTWREKFQQAKKAGFDFIEISIDETDEKLSRLDWTKEERLEFVKTMYEEDMPILSMCLSGHRRFPLGSAEEAVRKKSLEIMEKAIALAVDLGIRVIQLAGYDVYYEESTDETKVFFLENLKKSAEMAGAAGVSLGFETMETEFMNTVGKAMYYVDEVKSPYLGVYPDSGNLKNASVLYGTDMYEDLKSGEGHVMALHLKETKPGVFREVPFGQGHVDFAKVIDTAWNMGIRRYVTEFWYTGNPAWEGDLRDANQRMRELLELVSGK